MIFVMVRFVLPRLISNVRLPWKGRTSEIKAFDVNSKLSENLASHINIFKKGVPFCLHSFLFVMQVVAK